MKRTCLKATARLAALFCRLSLSPEPYVAQKMDLLVDYAVRIRKKSDVWISSYPRSGNGWVRAMLYEVLTGSDPLDRPHQAHGQVLPDIHGGYIDSSQIPDYLDVRFFKSHFHFSRVFPRIIYLVRDPVDSIYSLYVRAAKKRGREMAPDRFIRDFYLKGLFRYWDAHVLSYLTAPYDERRIMVLRYEDILADPVKALSEIIAFSGTAHVAKSPQKVGPRHIDKFLLKRDVDVQNRTYHEKTDLLRSLQLNKTPDSFLALLRRGTQRSQLWPLRQWLGYG
ncbi:MAG: sulfotransferase domain-containing protein [Thermodesulfobacteriota bacterium]|nr:sulfotransferase domain-containing protein [Thermodesulfobacteriota bacterium]